MKKIILSMTSVALVFTLCFTSVFADSGWKKDKGGKIPYGIAKKLFDDSDNFEGWASKSIEKLLLKGIVKGVNGKFLPKNSVTKIEAVTMALRVMGWENEAASITRLPQKYKGKAVQDWAVGYVSLAYEKGILDDVDMMYFNPSEPVKRYEVAKYVIRALGYEEEAQENMDENLPFVDAPAVPQGAVGYVYLVNDMGIMKGDGKRFNPMGTLTRSEMAVLFNNLDEKVDSETDENEYTGTVYRLSSDSITIKMASGYFTYAVDEDVVVYEGGDRVDYSDLEKGSQVILQIEDEKVVYIEVIDQQYDDDKIISNFTGKLIEIENGSPINITLQIEDMRVIFKVLSDVEVFFNGTKGEFSEVKAGDDIKVTVDNRNRARKIYVYREREEAQEVEGIIQEADSSSIKVLVNSTVKEYDYDDDVTLDIEGYSDSYSNLEKGMKVELKILKSLVTTIYAEDNEFKVEGEITAISLSGDGYTISIKVDGKVYTYNVDEDVEIAVDDNAADINDLEIGQEGKFNVVNLTITEMELED